jgi:6-phosphogluconolactonase
MDIYTPKLSHHEDEHIMIESIKTIIYTLAEDSIYSTGTFRIAVAGGKTPISLYKEISKLNLDWQNIELYQTDERFVDPNDDKSNQKMIKTTFDEAIDKGADFYSIKIQDDLDLTVKAYDTEISLLDAPIFDLIILGAGIDGHIASIFPNAQYLKGETDFVIKTTTDEFDVKERISLSVSSILSSKNIFVYITGEDKYSIIEEVFFGTKRVVEYPIKTLLAHPEVTLFYCADSINE